MRGQDQREPNVDVYEETWDGIMDTKRDGDRCGVPDLRLAPGWSAGADGRDHTFAFAEFRL